MSNKPQNVKGMRDHLPQAMLLRQYIISTLTGVFERYGFEPLSTPVVEHAETLEGKLGEDEKLIYRFEDHGGRRLALRYDQTVPLARVVAQYGGELAPRMPWRRYAIGQSYRGERNQKGRYREFWQADVDIVGSASPLADAEIVAVLTDGLSALGFPEFTTMLNHRQVIGGIARVSGLDEGAAGGVYRAIDKLDKIGPDGVRQALLDFGVSAEAAGRILSLVLLEGSAEGVLKELSGQLATDERALAALDNLRAIITALGELGVPASRYTVAPRLARGLSYYTGLVFEAITPIWPEGAILGGGRYDELIGLFSGKAVPTVGLAFGIDRLHDVMEALNLGPRPATTAHVFVSIFGEAQLAESLQLARELRAAGVNVVTSLEVGNVGKQFKEADRKGVPLVLVLGPDDVARGEVVIKELASGNQRSIARSAVVQELMK
ncbi:MAG: histidine--tRNA ligase [Chloroflexaceae bacterium]|jgi:histidyl-tRNA synthetase|nr:histidine--tRNA ligase [Chloroflexaceae bacterium]